MQIESNFTTTSTETQRGLKYDKYFSAKASKPDPSEPQRDTTDSGMTRT